MILRCLGWFGGLGGDDLHSFVVDAGFLEDFGAGVPAEFFVEGDGGELGVAVEAWEGEFGECSDFDGDHKVGADAFALALGVDADLLDLACGFVGAGLRWVEGGGADDPFFGLVALWMVDDGDEVFALFFSAWGDGFVVFDGVAEWSQEDGGAEGDLLLIEGMVH